jgi:hypothetical protein
MTSFKMWHRCSGLVLSEILKKIKEIINVGGFDIAEVREHSAKTNNSDQLEKYYYYNSILQRDPPKMLKCLISQKTGI